ncbi:hypothetical protein C8Q80DRAFT_1123557 [Daedaleopsis nitida]|nr:hypothetical protein C8Q80DRAFT_1123557 [Daedaleopsis nitida]
MQDQRKCMGASEPTSPTAKVNRLERSSRFHVTLYGHDASIHAFLFAPSGNLIATCSADRTVRITDDGGVLASEATDGLLCVRRIQGIVPWKDATAEGQAQLSDSVTQEKPVPPSNHDFNWTATLLVTPSRVSARPHSALGSICPPYQLPVLPNSTSAMESTPRHASVFVLPLDVRFYGCVCIRICFGKHPRTCSYASDSPLGTSSPTCW